MIQVYFLFVFCVCTFASVFAFAFASAFVFLFVFACVIVFVFVFFRQSNLTNARGPQYMRGIQKKKKEKGKTAPSHRSTLELACRLLGVSIFGHIDPDRLATNSAVWSADDDDDDCICTCMCNSSCICICAGIRD